MDGDGGLSGYDRSRRRRTTRIARRARHTGSIGQWSAPAAVGIRNAAMRLAPSGAFLRSLTSVADWHP